MFTVQLTESFQSWLDGLRDIRAQVSIARRIARMAEGNLGDVKPVGDGVFEMREHFGPGWRMYYVQHGAVLIVMLGGGDKATQTADIAKAIRLAATLED